MLLGGFQMLSGANNSKSLDEGKQKITSAIIGFIFYLLLTGSLNS
jgi:hypothetical protein